MLAVDQFEEILADRAGAGEEDLIAGLLELPATVVLALRADFYGRALRHPGLAEVLQTGQVLVTPMNEDELRRAIVMRRSGPGWSWSRAWSTCCCAR